MSGFVIGFGSNEREFEDSQEQAIRDHIVARFRAQGLSYFTDEFVAEIDGWLKERGEESRRQSKAYDKAEDFPSRYSSFWPTVVADASHIVCILKFHHINRRHALSPDGWALLQSKRLFDVVSYEIEQVSA